MEKKILVMILALGFSCPFKMIADKELPNPFVRQVVRIHQPQNNQNAFSNLKRLGKAIWLGGVPPFCAFALGRYMFGPTDGTVVICAAFLIYSMKK